MHYSIINTLKENGFEAYLVGGCVRDMLLGYTQKDYDIVTNALPEQIEKIFNNIPFLKTVPVGKAFGVITIVIEGNLTYEVATYRKDKNHDGRHCDIEFGNLYDDAHRRDFTINALYYDGTTVLDPTGMGLNDIETHTLRCIGDPNDRFNEDYLRMLRALRFQDKYNFTIEPRTLASIGVNAHKINKISAERIRDELLKIKDFRGLRNTGLLYYILPEVAQLEETEQDPIWHPEGDVLTHTLMLTLHSDDPIVRMAALLHDTGKFETTKIINGRVTAHGHEQVSGEIAERVCKRLKFCNKDTEDIVWLVANHMRVGRCLEMRKGKRIKFMRDPRFSKLLELHKCDALSSGTGDLTNYYKIKEEFEKLTPEQVKPTKIFTGNDLIDLGVKPGPVFKEILEAIEEAQLEGNCNNKADATKIALDFIRWL